MKSQVNVYLGLAMLRTNASDPCMGNCSSPCPALIRLRGMAKPSLGLMLRVCADNVHHSLLPMNIYEFRLIPYRDYSY